MTLDNRVKIWIQKAEYDLETAKAMLKAKRYLYVGFMCQQALEKLLKANYLTEKMGEPPYTHNLRFLAESLSISFSPQTLRFFDKVVAYYVTGRYPSYKETLAKRLTKDSSREILKETREIFQWLLSQLKRKMR